MITPTEKRLRWLEDNLTFLKAKVETQERQLSELTHCSQDLINLRLMHMDLEKRVAECEDMHKRNENSCSQIEFYIRTQLKTHSEQISEINHVNAEIKIAQDSHSQMLNEMRKQLPEVWDLASRASHAMRDLHIKILQHRNTLEEQKKILDLLSQTCYALKKDIKDLNIDEIRDSIRRLISFTPQTTKSILNNEEITKKLTAMEGNIASMYQTLVSIEMQEPTGD